MHCVILIIHLMSYIKRDAKKGQKVQKQDRYTGQKGYTVQSGYTDIHR